MNKVSEIKKTVQELYKELEEKSMNKKTGVKRGFSQQEIRDAVLSIFKQVKADKLLLSAIVKMLQADKKFAKAKYTEFRTAILYKKQFVLEKVDGRTWIKKATSK